MSCRYVVQHKCRESMSWNTHMSWGYVVKHTYVLGICRGAKYVLRLCRDEHSRHTLKTYLTIYVVRYVVGHVMSWGYVVTAHLTDSRHIARHISRFYMSWGYVVSIRLEGMCGIYVVKITLCLDPMSCVLCLDTSHDMSWAYVVTIIIYVVNVMSWTDVLEVCRELIRSTYVLRLCVGGMSWTYW